MQKLVTYKQCRWCGDIVSIQHPKDYAYKYQAKGKMYYFCGWNCMCKCRKANPAKVNERTGSESYPEPVGTWQRKIE